MLKKIVYALAFLFLLSGVSFSAPGDLDPTFGEFGVFTYDGSDMDEGSAVAIQEDGKVVIVGKTAGASSSDALVLRLNPDGTLDNMFAGDGTVTYDGGGNDRGNAIVIQKDGKIVVAGSSSKGTEDVLLLRYNPDGTLDDTFGDNGVVTYDGSGGDLANAVAIQEDGKIVAVGYTVNSTYDVLVLRYNPDGTLDNTFGDNGVVTYDGGYVDIGYGIAIQENGKILVAGFRSNGTDWDALVLRYNSDGTLDNTFGGDGIVTYDSGDMDSGYGIAIQENGKIVVVGERYSSTGTFGDILILRYNSNGTLDNTFSGNGVATYDNGNFESGTGIAIQEDGKIVIVGVTRRSISDVLVLRFNTNGALDKTFGENGIVKYHGSADNDDWSVAGAIQTNGNIIIAGRSHNNSQYDVLALRLHGGDPDETPPTPNPMIWLTPPYKTGTDSIAMVATTATDPTPPISYYFDFVGSPTGGLGGKDSVWQSGTSYTNSNLRANHKYGYRVKAKDGLNNQTAYSTIRYAYTAIEAPTGITFGAVTSSSIQVRSTKTPSGLTRGSSGLWIENMTQGTNSDWKKNNTLWTNKSLSPNTNYTFRAKARNGDGVETNYSSLVSKYTRANLPGVASFSNVTRTSIRANWTDNDNPSGTLYFCQNVTTGANSGWITNTYWESDSLSYGKSYSFKVKAKNGEGIETGWTSLGKQTTVGRVVIVNPNGGPPPLKQGQIIDIAWTAYETTQPITKVQLSYTKDGGATYNSIITLTGIYPPGDYSQTWKVPPVGTTPKTKCKVKVVLKDEKGVIQGSDVSDNYFTIEPLVPDLIETTVSDPPTTALPGGSFSVTDTVENRGDADAGPSTTQYYLSVNTTKGTGDILLTGTRSVPALVPGATSTGTMDVTIPSSTAAGTYYLLACADDKKKVAESNETNNCVASTSTMQVTRPDLIETSVSNPPTASLPGKSFSVTDTAKNQGKADAGTSTTQYYLSVNTSKGTDDILLKGTRPVPALAPEATSTGTVEVTIPSGLAAGAYYLLACADDLKAVAESNETNNCIASTNRVQISGPDLIETSVSNPPQQSFKAGSSFNVTDTVKNQGNVAAGDSVTRYYLSKDTFKGTEDVRLTGGRFVAGLAPEATLTGTVSVMIPSGTEGGAYYLLACADDMEAIAETDDTNNCIASGTTVQVIP